MNIGFIKKAIKEVGKMSNAELTQAYDETWNEITSSKQSYTIYRLKTICDDILNRKGE